MLYTNYQLKLDYGHWPLSKQCMVPCFIAVARMQAGRLKGWGKRQSQKMAGPKSLGVIWAFPNMATWLVAT